MVGVASTSVEGTATTLPGTSAQYVNLAKNGVLEWLGKPPDSAEPEFPVKEYWTDEDGSRVHQVWIRGRVKPGQGLNTVFNVSIKTTVQHFFEVTVFYLDKGRQRNRFG